MRSLVLVLALAACGKDTKSAPAPEPHKDERARPQPEDPALAVDAVIDGATAHWDKAAFDKVPKSVGKNTGGADRDLWSLRDLAHTLVGPSARIVAVGNATTTQKISPADWDDVAQTPMLQVTRRGTFKFRWIDSAGKWGEAEVKDVTKVEVTK